MTPAQLLPASFAAYPPLAKAFAVEFLPLLQRMPLAVCPSFLQQILAIDTSFPAERDLLDWQCRALRAMPQAQFEQLVAPLRELQLSPQLQAYDWLRAPAAFLEELTAFLWSSGTMPRFRAAAQNLFAAIPPKQDDEHRLVIVLLGQGATVSETTLLRKLRKHGVFLTALDRTSAMADIARAVQAHTSEHVAPYASWYIDGGEPHATLQQAAEVAVTASYQGLAPLRTRVLQRMQATMESGSAGPELMRSRLANTTAHEVGAAELTADPVLARFYTELFTLSSGPQLFSTSFVQWAGRELARRARPRTLLLRYAPRRQHHDLNELFLNSDTGALDPQASLRDAEMGAYLNWIEMGRVAAPGRLTFAAVVEDKPFAVILGSGAAAHAGMEIGTPMSLKAALGTYGAIAL